MSFTNPSMLANSALISDKSISPKIPPSRPAEVMKAEKLLLEEMDEVLDRSSEVAPDLYLAKMLIVTERERERLVGSPMTSNLSKRVAQDVIC